MTELGKVAPPIYRLSIIRAGREGGVDGGGGLGLGRGAEEEEPQDQDEGQGGEGREGRGGGGELLLRYVVRGRTKKRTRIIGHQSHKERENIPVAGTNHRREERLYTHTGH
eukprot:1180109-Prorocentrum_minimum.AAC.1